jgi:hypothetical protein
MPSDEQEQGAAGDALDVPERGVPDLSGAESADAA